MNTQITEENINELIVKMEELKTTNPEKYAELLNALTKEIKGLTEDLKA